MGHNCEKLFGPVDSFTAGVESNGETPVQRASSSRDQTFITTEGESATSTPPPPPSFGYWGGVFALCMHVYKPGGAAA